MRPTDDGRPRLLVLGAGRHQIDLICRAEERGVAVVVSDYYPDSPGKDYATYPTNTDALDVAANIELALRYEVDGVITTGTDLAVVTMAEVAAAHNLPCYLTPQGAQRATNKILMAEAFADAAVSRPAHIEVTNQRPSAETDNLRMPVVVKPADSQGQRGIRKVDDRSNLAAAVQEAIAQSRTEMAIIEEYVDGHEVTASAWGHGGRSRLLMVTDRVTYNPPPALGICFQHIFPSQHAADHLSDIRRCVQAIAGAYHMTEGPLYVQLLIDGDNVYVVEAGGRVGGGHEASLIPLVTGVDVIDRLVDLALTGTTDPVEIDYGLDEVATHALVNFLLATPGIVDRGSGFDELVEDGMVEQGNYYIGEGHQTQPIVDGQGRVGYFITKSNNREALMELSKRAYGRLNLRAADGENLLFWPPATLLNG